MRERERDRDLLWVLVFGQTHSPPLLNVWRGRSKDDCYVCWVGWRFSVLLLFVSRQTNAACTDVTDPSFRLNAAIAQTHKLVIYISRTPRPAGVTLCPKLPYSLGVRRVYFPAACRNLSKRIERQKTVVWLDVYNSFGLLFSGMMLAQRLFLKMMRLPHRHRCVFTPDKLHSQHVLR